MSSPRCVPSVDRLPLLLLIIGPVLHHLRTLSELLRAFLSLPRNVHGTLPRVPPFLSPFGPHHYCLWVKHVGTLSSIKHRFFAEILFVACSSGLKSPLCLRALPTSPFTMSDSNHTVAASVPRPRRVPVASSRLLDASNTAAPTLSSHKQAIEAH